MAGDWLETFEAAGLDGVIAKRLDLPYLPGSREAVMKVKPYKTADAVVVCAGMDGALPSVVGGLLDCPVIACPTSIGYGASFGGVAALLTMLNSCSAGVTVVNIDAGFKAGYTAALIVRRLEVLSEFTRCP